MKVREIDEKKIMKKKIREVVKLEARAHRFRDTTK